MSRALKNHTKDPRPTSGVSSGVRSTPCVTPHGRLVLARAEDAPELEEDRAAELERAFARGTGHGLLRLGACEVGRVLPPVFGWWREFAAHFVTALCARPDVAEARAGFVPPEPPTDV